MHVLVVTYDLSGITEGEYIDVANDLTGRFSSMPGLQAKLWLANTDEGRYGAVYLWDDRESMERFLRSDLFEDTNPDFSDVVAEDFEVLENLTGATQPVLELVPPRRQPPSRAVRPAPARKAMARTTGARKIPVTTKSAPTSTGATKTAAATPARAKSAATKTPAAKSATKGAPARSATAKKTPAKATAGKATRRTGKTAG